VTPARLGLEAMRGGPHLEGIRDQCKALVQGYADLRVARGNQCEMGVLLVSCYAGLLWDSEPWSLAIVDLPSSEPGVYEPSSPIIPCLPPALLSIRDTAGEGVG
jgi:hypothetical protein